MYQMPAAIWNRIAAEQALETPMANRVFPMDQAELDHWIQDRETELMAQGIYPSVVSAYLTLTPLLWENAALQAFKMDHPIYSPALPDVGSMDDAILIARADRPLNEEELAQLRRLLMRRPT
jgi:hypothetical protein